PGGLAHAGGGGAGGGPHLGARHGRGRRAEPDEDLLRRRHGSAPVHVVEAHDVVLLEGGARLHLDEGGSGVPAWIKVHSFSEMRMVSPSRSTRAVPCTTTQCSARW